MTQIPTVLRLSDDEPETPQNFYHELVVWLSLKSLTCYWEVYPGIIENLPVIREAAREALFEYHEHTRDGQVEELFKAGLKKKTSGALCNQITQFLDGAVRVNAAMNGTENRLADWYRWMSPNQHNLEVPGINAGATAKLSNQYQEEVVKAYREQDEYVRKTVKTEFLDDWDLFIHQAYEASYEESDRWPESVILIAIDQLYSNMRFNHFMRSRVLELPKVDQQLMLEEIRRQEKQDIDDMKESDDLSELDLVILDLPENSEAEVQKIRPAKEIVIW